MPKTFKFTASFPGGSVKWIPDSETQKFQRQGTATPGRPQDFDARKGDTFTLGGLHVLFFKDESPFPTAPPDGPPFVYLAGPDGVISLTVAVDIAPNSTQHFKFRCGQIAGPVIVGLDHDGDEIVVVSP